MISRSRATATTERRAPPERPIGAQARSISLARIGVLGLFALGCDGGRSKGAPPDPPAPASVIEAAVAIVAHDASCAPAAPALVCSGTLIEPDIVLTAAHCLGADPPASFDVIAGPDLSGPRARVRAGSKHPNFDRSTFTHDVAVLVLARPLSIAPIPLRRAPFASAGATLEAIGYGGAKGGPAGVVRQRRGLVRLDSLEDLRLKVLPITGMTCRGDSGGPVLARDGERLELAGVTTHGDPACRDVGFAARIDRHIDFIEAQIAAARAPSPPRRPFDPSEDLCRAPCAADADCPAGLACAAAERRCSFEGLPPARFGVACSSACDGELACVRVSASECRCLNPCTPLENKEPARPATRP